MSQKKNPKGGEFILIPGEGEFCFTPEDMSEEHRMILQTTKDFIVGEVLPKKDLIEEKDEATVRALFAAAGELGLLGTDVPEEFGGLGLDKISTAAVTEAFGLAGSLAVAQGAHTGIGTLPIVYYGNQEQKAKYLPDLATGAKIAAYGLTESGAGSDAVGGCRTKAVLSSDGKHYILNGEKMFITNGGWASTFVVFAKINGADFSAFIVERDFPGVSTGPEEKKMGIRGSSTTTVILEDAQVPVENLLYQQGKGHHIALNVLNIGRYKLGLAAMGGCKVVLGMATAYAKGRVQFGRAISEFGAMREKLARMAVKTYLSESLQYRTVGLIEAGLGDTSHADPDYADKASKAIREYNIECSLAKIYGSEALDFVVDENVQIHGGYGFVSEYDAERAYRDSRINRIFEGTNEVNRLLVPGELLKRGMKGTLPLLPAAMGLQGWLMEYSPMMVELPDEPLAYQAHMVEMCKKAILMVAGTAAQKYMQKLANEQELLMRVADMVIETYALESGLLRARKAIASLGEDKAAFYSNAVMAGVDESIPKIEAWAKESLAYMEEGDNLRMLLVGIRKILKYQPENAIKIRQAIADRVIDKNGYPLG